jgi:hypothetical protein
VELGGAGGSDADFFDIVGADLRVLPQNFPERVNGRMIATAAGIGLETDVERLKPFSQLVSEV